MGNQMLASKIIVEEEAPSLRGIPSLDTAVAGFVGVTEKGPVGVATLVNSPSDFQRIFGGWTANSVDMCAAVDGFFLNGGSQLYIVRATVYSGGLSTAAKGTVTLTNSSDANTLRVDGKYAGTYSHGYLIKVTPASSDDATEFNLEVRTSASGIIVETWPNLTMDTTKARYAPTIVNDENSGSSRIAVVDLALAGGVDVRRPEDGSSAALTGGDDALPAGNTEYIGTQADGNGLYAFDIVDDITLLAVPGMATSAVQGAMVAYAEGRDGQIFCILDALDNRTYTQALADLADTQIQSEFAGLYWPQVKIPNPSRALFGNVEDITVPPCGHIAGMFARTDNARPGGVWDPPAGTEAGKILGLVGLADTNVLKEAVRDRLLPKLINPITTMTGFPYFVDGARTLKSDGNFPTIAQRRGVSFVERSIKLGLQFARHKNNTPALRSQVYRTVYAFLRTQADLGAFASQDSDKAFFVDVGEALNPATSPNVLTARIGLATNRPAEYIRLLFSQDTRALDAAMKG